jgi:hypothetical protein
MSPEEILQKKKITEDHSWESEIAYQLALLNQKIDKGLSVDVSNISENPIPIREV